MKEVKSIYKEVEASARINTEMNESFRGLRAQRQVDR